MRPSTTRSIPARSCAPLDLAEPEVARPARRPRRPAPRRPPAQRRPPARSARRSAAARDRGDRLEAVGPGEQRLARLLLGDLRLQRVPVALGDVGRLATTRSNRRPAGHRAALEARPGRRGRARSAFARATSSARPPRCRSRSPSHSGSSSATARAIAPDPVPTSSTDPRLELERDLDQQLGLRPRDQRPAVDRQLESGGSPCGRGCRRPARAGPAAAPSRRTGARRPSPTDAVRLGREPRPIAARRLGEQQLGVEARRVDAGGLEGVGRRREGLAYAARPTAAAHQDAASAVCASRRCRFSSAASASVNSRRSPASTSSRLCAVSLIRWSVTRPWGKL